MTFEELNAKHGVTVVPHADFHEQLLVGYFPTTQAAQAYITEASLVPECVFHPGGSIAGMGTQITVWVRVNRTA